MLRPSLFAPIWSYLPYRTGWKNYAPLPARALRAVALRGIARGANITIPVGRVPHNSEVFGVYL